MAPTICDDTMDGFSNQNRILRQRSVINYGEHVYLFIRNSGQHFLNYIYALQKIEFFFLNKNNFC